jgi:predicted fused transcriptional regulator/phosphomethylpyrimidine kinase
MENEALVTHFLDQSDAWTRDIVRRHGWAVEYVFGEGEKYPPVAYTVGLYGLSEHPELAIFGKN